MKDSIKQLSKGKTLSKIGKVISLIFVISTFFFLPERNVDSIIKVGAFILAVFAPIDLSIWISLFKSK